MTAQDQSARTLGDGFKDAMRRLAGTVAIVTVDSGGERHGTTATAVTSLSMDPPSLLVCFNKDSRLHGMLGKTDQFCVNLLHADNLVASRLFASPVSSAERFAHDRRTDDRHRCCRPADQARPRPRRAHHLRRHGDGVGGRSPRRPNGRVRHLRRPSHQERHGTRRHDRRGLDFRLDRRTSPPRAASRWRLPTTARQSIASRSVTRRATSAEGRLRLALHAYRRRLDSRAAPACRCGPGCRPTPPGSPAACGSGTGGAVSGAPSPRSGGFARG